MKENDQQVPESVTLPAQVFQAVLELVSSMPWKQVQPLMAELIKAAKESGG